MNPQDTLNQSIRLLIGDLQVQLMIANTRVQELEAQLAAADTGKHIPEVSRPNGKGSDDFVPPPNAK